ncbi:MAG: hypothetical protein GY757_05165 [bacterium]|nr:hypothetical protein [bacterium]
MTDQKFSIEKALRFGLETFQKDALFLVGLVFFVMLVNLSPYLVETYAMDKVGDYLTPIKIIAWFFQVLTSMGMIKICLKYVDKQETEAMDLFSCTSFFFNYLLASLVYLGVVVLGTVLFIIPGIILGLRFQFYDYLIIDKNLGIKEAFSGSEKLTTHAMGDLFRFIVLLIAINLIGLFLFGVGLLITAPISTLAMAHVYRQLEASVPIENRSQDAGASF